MKTTIFFASSTSGTGSMIRIFCNIGDFDKAKCKYVDRFMLEGRLDELSQSIVPVDGRFHVFNRPIDFNRSMQLENYRFIVNFRDPRDRLCNVFHWKQSHPMPGISDAELRVRRQRVLDIGIDSWVLQQAKSEVRYYDNFWWILEKSKVEIVILSYAELCLDFDTFVKRAFEFLKVDMTDEVKASVEPERVDNLPSNASWIGNRWAGSDTKPGRYLNELQPETVSKLNIILGDTLKKMATFDPKYKDLYLHGIL